MAKVKYRRGSAPPGATRWVFGIVDTNTRLCHIELVEDRSANTLIPIIQRLVLPGHSFYNVVLYIFRKFNLERLLGCV